ncbi:hypothetical protein Bca101_065794 [Brassica carinata]
MNVVFIPLRSLSRSHSSRWLELPAKEHTLRLPLVRILVAEVVVVPPLETTMQCFFPKATLLESNSMKLSSAQQFQGGFILEKVMGSLSTGHMELRTRNTNDNPVVTFSYFQHPDDLKRCVRGIQTIERVVQSKAFARFKYADMSFDYLLNLTASTPVNLRPPRSGRGASLPPSAEEFLPTYGYWYIDRLRVIDMSTVGYCPGTNPQATIMMLGR